MSKSVCERVGEWERVETETGTDTGTETKEGAKEEGCESPLKEELLTELEEGLEERLKLEEEGSDSEEQRGSGRNNMAAADAADAAALLNESDRQSDVRAVQEQGLGGGQRQGLEQGQGQEQGLALEQAAVGQKVLAKPSKTTPLSSPVVHPSCR